MIVGHDSRVHIRIFFLLEISSENNKSINHIIVMPIPSGRVPESQKSKIETFSNVLPKWTFTKIIISFNVFKYSILHNLLLYKKNLYY